MDPRTLRRRYEIDRLPVAAIAAEAGVNQATIHRRLRAAGIPTRGVAQRTSWDDVLTPRRLRAAARAGRTHVDVAHQTGAPVRVVQDHWRRLGLDPDAPSDADIARRYGAGESLAELAAAAGVSVRTVARRIRAAGVDLRPPGRPAES